MIHITVAPKKYQIRIKGHAHYDEPGKDIVCASCSMAFYNLAQMIHMYDAEKAFCKKPKMIYDKGKGYIEVMPREEYEPWIQHDFTYATAGFQMLAAQYPDFVDLKMTEY